MTETQLLIVTVGILATVIGWMGSRVIVRLDMVVDRLNNMAGELHTRINVIDTRLVRVETMQDKANP